MVCFYYQHIIICNVSNDDSSMYQMMICVSQLNKKRDKHVAHPLSVIRKLVVLFVRVDKYG